jgi:hypothetical protein
VRVVVDVQNYQAAIAQVAQASLRSIIGKSELDDLLSNRERLNQGLELMLDSPAVDWGIHIDRVDIKDVALPESMKRSMSRQAEAERERRSRVITAEGELQASEKLAQAAEVMAASSRPPCSCACCRRWSRWRRRRTRPSCCRSRSSCCAEELQRVGAPHPLRGRPVDPGDAGRLHPLGLLPASASGRLACVVVALGPLRHLDVSAHLLQCLHAAPVRRRARHTRP